MWVEYKRMVGEVAGVEFWLSAQFDRIGRELVWQNKQTWSRQVMRFVRGDKVFEDEIILDLDDCFHDAIVEKYFMELRQDYIDDLDRERDDEELRMDYYRRAM